jgi:hypothetical protein
MKKILVYLFLCFAPLSAWSQDTPATQEEADKLDSLVLKLMNYKRYDDALTAKLREVDILKQLRGEKDSAYLCNKAFLGKIYYRLRKAEEAAKITTEAAEEYGEHVSNKDENYAFYLDNASIYWASINEFAKAKELSRRSLTVYEQLGKQDFDLANILIHMAENCDGNGQPQEAIKYDLLALNLLKKITGEHSDNYIEELGYLQRYYEHAGDANNAKKTKEHAERLAEEKEQGYVDLPEPIQFKTPEICHEHNDDALTCIAYYLTHMLSAPNMNQAAQYVINWSVASEDVNIAIGEKLSKLALSQESMPYFTAFIAASSYYCLTENVKQLDEPLFVKAVTALLQFYEPNRKLTGKVEVLEDYLKEQEKGKLEKQLHKDFLADQKLQQEKQ